jgi:hypothetical protein
MDLLLDSQTDLSLVSGDLALADGSAEAAQRIRDALKTLQGEWFLDTTYGLPYIQQILVKNPSMPILGALFKQAILAAVDSGARLTQFDLRLTNATRQLTCTFSVQLPSGQSTGPVQVTFP